MGVGCARAAECCFLGSVNCLGVFMKKAEKQHLDKVQQLGCIACQKLGFYGTPAEIHHIRTGIGKGQRASNYQVIPLCPHHHRNGGHGEAFHAGPKVWQERFGYETDLLDEINSMVSPLRE